MADGSYSTALNPAAPVCDPAYEARVLILDPNHKPLGLKTTKGGGHSLYTIPTSKALELVHLGRVYVHAYTGDYVRSRNHEMAVPDVVVLKRSKEWWPLDQQARHNLRTLMIRDARTCVYCGNTLCLDHKSPDLRASDDHYFPKSRLSAAERANHGWHNSLLACARDNSEKSDLLPHRYKAPAHEPWVPSLGDLVLLWATDERLREVPAAWLEPIVRVLPNRFVLSQMDKHAEATGRDPWAWQRDYGLGRAA